jgi:hypothetical protein
MYQSQPYKNRTALLTTVKMLKDKSKSNSEIGTRNNGIARKKQNSMAARSTKQLAIKSEIKGSHDR